MELLLLSNSTNHGRRMYVHAADAFAEMAGDRVVTFIPFALADWDDYADRAVASMRAFGVTATSAHNAAAPDRAILEAEVVMMGGGNTFRLLDSLCHLKVIDGLRERVRAGEIRYMAASAGTNMVCPSIRTTNDMPICQPPVFDALGLIPFQINSHYVDADPRSTHMGETRETRIEEFLEENDCPVLAMYEGSWLRIRDERATLTGPARLFQREGCDALESGADLSHLLQLTPTFDGGRRPQPGAAGS